MQVDSSSSSQRQAANRPVERPISSVEIEQAVQTARNFGSDSGYTPGQETVAAMVYFARLNNDQRYQANPE